MGVEREQEGRAAELAALSSALFSGADAGEPAGVVQFAEAHGHHAQALTLMRLVQHFLQRGVAAHNIALVVPGASFLSEEMLGELAQAEIPFSCNLTVPLEHTELGLGLLLALRTAKGLLADGAVVVDEGTISCPPPAGHADNSYAPLAALLSCRACGLAEIDSRALRLRWRKRGQSCAQARMQDLTRGIRRNMSKASTAAWQNATEPLRLLLVQAIRTVQSSFENEQLERLLDLLVANVAKAGQLDDALAAAGTVRAHTELYRPLGLAISLQKLERMQVSLSRSFGVKTAGEGLKVLTASEATSAQFEVAILCGLSADYFPMVGRPSVFKGVLEAHGVFESDHTALLQRRNLLNIIDGCSQGFGAWRAAHDAGADELRQSALWDELLEVYAEPPVMRVSEDERFAQCAQEGSGVPATWRTQAKLMRESSISDLLMPNFELNEIFSPTALEAYVQCPYGWFTSRRLGILEYDRGFDAALQGNIAHDSFERFYRQLQAAGHKRVTPENLPMAQELIAGAVDETVAAYKARGALYLHSHKEEQDIARIRQQLVKFVERDAQFLPGFTPRYCELRLGYEQEEHPLEYAGVRVRGKVDRIDVSEDGTQAVIVDYKMSKLATGYGLTDKQNTPTRIQTDIYATLVERHFVQLGTPLRVVGSVYRSYSANVLRGVYSSGIEWGGLEGLNKNDAVPRHNDKQPELSVEKYPVYLQRIEALVAQRMEELKAGNISAAPITKDACKYCKAAHVCQKRRG